MAATLALAALTALAIACGGGAKSTGTPPPATADSALTTADVQTIVGHAANSVASPLAIAVVDRTGAVLGTFFANHATRGALTLGNFGNQVDSEEQAVSLARTAAFFSNDQAPLSSRTVRFISGIHFPPGVSFTGNADLYGIENTNRGCITRQMAALHPGKFIVGIGTALDGASPGLGIATGKADLTDSVPTAVNPGGVPLFKAGHLAGGVGVVSLAGRLDVAEFAAFIGSHGSPDPKTCAAGSCFLDFAAIPPPDAVLIAGIELPFVNQVMQPSGVPAVGGDLSHLNDAPAGAPGAVAAHDGSLPPDRFLLGPLASPELTAAEVKDIVIKAVNTANLTRAVIRLPQGSRTRMSIAVSDLAGNLLAVYRMPDGTIFSLDVAATKARNVVWFSNPGNQLADTRPGAVDLKDDLTGSPAVAMGTAITNRTISFGAMPLFPPGIDGSQPGPFFQHLYVFDTQHPCTQGSQAPNANQSGIVFFPGSLPLYRNGTMVGGLGVSGDGVDQDDFVTSGGAQGYEAPTAIRADNDVVRNVRLPYLKFPRNPTD
jgi:uncharacterized protein GlcG (DUF336 family)